MRRVILAVALLLVAPACRYSYLVDPPLMLPACDRAALESPRLTATYALVTALQANNWTILHVSPQADRVDANYCRRGGKACTTIEGRIDYAGAIEVRRVEPSTDISHGHRRALSRWMGSLRRRHDVLRCHRLPLDDFRATWKIDPDV